MSIVRESALLLFFSLCAAAGTHLLHPRAPSWYQANEPLRDGEVTLEIIHQRWHDDVLWIDARPLAQYKAGHAPSALLLNEESADLLLMEHFEKLQDNTKPVIVYCGSEACRASQKIASYLRDKLPLTEIHVLRGGWTVWSQKHGAGVK
jgi:rhodanese-related sulfurtransferase